jgi:hypothetical protein
LAEIQIILEELKSIWQDHGEQSVMMILTELMQLLFAESWDIRDRKCCTAFNIIMLPLYR